MTPTPDELRQLLADARHTPYGTERLRVLRAIAESVPSLLDELDRANQRTEWMGENVEDLADHLHRKQQQLDEARRELEELRSAARSAVECLKDGRPVSAMNHLSALVAPSVPETEETP